MDTDTTTEPRQQCRRCGFEAAVESDAWGRVSHPPLGTLTQCRECGSTDLVRAD